MGALGSTSIPMGGIPSMKYHTIEPREAIGVNVKDAYTGMALNGLMCFN